MQQTGVWQPFKRFYMYLVSEPPSMSGFHLCHLEVEHYSKVYYIRIIKQGQTNHLTSIIIVCKWILFTHLLYLFVCLFVYYLF